MRKLSPQQKLHFGILQLAFILAGVAFVLLQRVLRVQISLSSRVAIAVTIGTIAYVLFLLEARRNAKKWDKLERELEEDDEPPVNRLDHPMPGFVALQSLGLSNQTFLVVIGPEALYGWRIKETASSNSPMYYLAYLYVLDSEAMRDIDGIQELAAEPGSFVIPRTSIASVTAIAPHQRRMAGVLHSGSVRIDNVDGPSQEFLILGTESPESVRAKILGLSISVEASESVPLPYLAPRPRTEAVLVTFGLVICAAVICYAACSHYDWRRGGLFGFLGLCTLALLAIQYFLSKTIFTNAGIEKIDGFGRTRRFEYDSLESIDVPTREGGLRLVFRDDRVISLHWNGETLRTILGILARKTDKLPHSIR